MKELCSKVDFRLKNLGLFHLHHTVLTLLLAVICDQCFESFLFFIFSLLSPPFFASPLSKRPQTSSLSLHIDLISFNQRISITLSYFVANFLRNNNFCSGDDGFFQKVGTFAGWEVWTVTDISGVTKTFIYLLKKRASLKNKKLKSIL